MSFPHRPRLLGAAIVACSLLAAPGTASAVSYGIADAPSICTSWGASACNSWGYGFASYFAGRTGLKRPSAFTVLKSNLPFRYARLSAPYDAVYDASPSTGQCRWSYDYTSHTSWAYPSGGGPGSACTASLRRS